MLLPLNPESDRLVKLVFLLGGQLLLSRAHTDNLARVRHHEMDVRILLPSKVNDFSSQMLLHTHPCVLAAVLKLTGVRNANWMSKLCRRHGIHTARRTPRPHLP